MCSDENEKRRGASSAEEQQGKAIDQRKATGGGGCRRRAGARAGLKEGRSSGLVKHGRLQAAAAADGRPEATARGEALADHVCLWQKVGGGWGEKTGMLWGVIGRAPRAGSRVVGGGGEGCVEERAEEEGGVERCFV